MNQERVFVGRQDELAELNGYLEKDLAVPGQVCFVTGEAGAGKKALVRSVQGLVEIAPDLIGVLVPGGKLLAVLGQATKTKAGWMDQLERLAGKPAAQAVDQGHVFEQYTAFLQRLSAKMPLILFLDDLQWADGASLGLLFHLGRPIETSRILVLGAYRPNDVALGREGGRHPLEPMVHELTRYYGDVTVDLDAIPEASGRRFVDALLDVEGFDTSDLQEAGTLLEELASPAHKT